MSRIDNKFAALREQGFTGAVSDMTLQWLQANGATSNQISDAWLEMLAAQGYTDGQRNDLWFQFLDDRGYEGALPDREAAFWEDGGIIGESLPPVDLDNVYQGFGNEIVTFDTGIDLTQFTVWRVALRLYVIEHDGTSRTLVTSGTVDGPADNSNFHLVVHASDEVAFRWRNSAGSRGALTRPCPTGKWVTVDAGQTGTQWFLELDGDRTTWNNTDYEPDDTSGILQLLGVAGQNAYASNLQMGRVILDMGDNEYRFVAPCAEGEGLVSLDYSRFRLEGVISDEVIHQTRLEDLVLPTIDVQPVPVTVTEPDPASFSVSASSNGEIFYLWQAELTPGSYTYQTIEEAFPGRTTGMETPSCTIDPTEKEDTRRIRCRLRAHTNDVPDYQVYTDEVWMTVEAAEYFHDFTTGDIGGWTHTRGSIATAPDEAGIIQTYTGDEPAFYRDQGLQLEAASTNRIPNTDMSSGTWAADGGLVKEGAHLTIPAPNGELEAYHHTGVLGGWLQAPGVQAGDTQSIYIRTVSGTGQAHILNHNSATGTLVQISEEWQQFELPDDAGGTGGPNIYGVDGRGSTDVDEILTWGPQLEAGILTSHIPTSTGAVTRNDTQCQATFEELGLPAEGVVNDFCFQFVCHLAYDFEEYSDGAKRFFSLRDNIDETSTVGLFSNSPANLRAWVLKDGAAVNVNISENDLALLGEGDYIDFRFRASSTDGLKLWAITRLGTFTGEVTANTANFTNPLMYAILGRRNPGTNANISNILSSSIRLVPTALSDEEIEGWS